MEYSKKMLTRDMDELADRFADRADALLERFIEDAELRALLPPEVADLGTDP